MKLALTLMIVFLFGCSGQIYVRDQIAVVGGNEYSLVAKGEEYWLMTNDEIILVLFVDEGGYLTFSPGDTEKYLYLLNEKVSSIIRYIGENKVVDPANSIVLELNSGELILSGLTNE